MIEPVYSVRWRAISFKIDFNSNNKVVLELFIKIVCYFRLGRSVRLYHLKRVVKPQLRSSLELLDLEVRWKFNEKALTFKPTSFIAVYIIATSSSDVIDDDEVRVRAGQVLKLSYFPQATQTIL